MANFLKSKQVGKIGESATIDFFISQGNNVIDVSESADYQKIGIDLIVDDEFVEVKTQSGIHNNNSITLELDVELQYNTNRVCKQGWFNTSEADKILFYDKETNTAYLIDLIELRNIFNENQEEISIYYYDEDTRKGTKISKLAFIDIDFLKSKSKTLLYYNYNNSIRQ